MMARKWTASRLSTLTLGGALLCGITLWTTSHSQSVDKPDTPLKVAMVLDCITQPRFQDDMINFGVSRLAPAAGGHLLHGYLSLKSPKDKELFKSAVESHRDFAIGFFHCTHVPGKRGKVSIAPPASGGLVTVQFQGNGKTSADRPAEAGRGGFRMYSVTPISNELRHMRTLPRQIAEDQFEQINKKMGDVAEKGLPKLMKGQDVTQDSGEWLVVARPVKAMKESCLKCHEGSKKGDTLGVMTYIVSKKTFADAGTPSKGRPNGP